MRQRLSFCSLVLAVLSWGLLLLGTLGRAHAVPGLAGWPRWGIILAQAVFVLFVFLYQRGRPDPLQGYDFVGLLRRLVRGPGLIAAVALALGLLERAAAVARLPAGGPALLAVVYTVNLGLFVVFLARTNYAWRSLILFRSTVRLRTEWALFEVLLGATLLLRLLSWHPPATVNTVVFTALALFGAYLGTNQKWVAYLSRRQKWQAVAYELLLLLGLLVFVQYFRATRFDPLLLAPEPQGAFLVLTAFFAAFYSVTGLLVTFFNLPTARVHEQRRAEVLSLQRLTQIIQRGQSEAEIYQTLLDAAADTAQADAAWLDVPAENPAGKTTAATEYYYKVSPAEATLLRDALAHYRLSGVNFVNNNLAEKPALAAVAPHYRSLVLLPLHGTQHRYGTLYLLKRIPYGFDPEEVSVLRSFTDQTVLSLENLTLATLALHNQRTQEELKIASEVQDSLIPKNLPTDDWFEISTHSLAAKEVGGDFYDFLVLPGRRLAVLIGDVSGKGVTAAFHMAQMKGIFHALMQGNPLAKNERDRFPLPSRFMAQANAALAHCLERSSFITSSLYIIDYEQGGFMFARAGHCHTLYYHALREEVFYFQSAGLGLGIIRNEGYEKHINNQFYDYGPGDVMVVYTDGIVEARGAGQEEYGEDRLKLRLEECYYQEADAIKQFILNDLNAFTTGQPIHDDQTLLVIKFKAVQPEPAA
ncbi:PP2C family protein-serine/threonine phosphatase [Hymenobacter caeli]|uniref:Serine phosphatase RsbU (Regulator of sigma subunit) n=1 Tax=Hymenobacter caeli TaxID=2735894 RepID=A0ABX2FV55_9BACT|nr:PP2C family protein-serine/threonine phosphatase [Hymenobacter caeli]NRT20842.1 serine phosphatase RsbU (regulator of sigma subunit) [Hymenobacter caeli]